MQIEIEQHRDQRVLKARYDDELVDELVFVAPHAAQALAQGLLLLRRQVVDDQHLEIGPVDAHLRLAPLFLFDCGLFVEV